MRPGLLTLVEGIGGVMVPLDERHTVLDLMVALAMPVILVSPTGLGAISHLLTAVAALQARGVALQAILLNETNGSGVPLDALARTIAGFCGADRLHTLRRHATEGAFDELLMRFVAMP